MSNQQALAKQIKEGNVKTVHFTLNRITINKHRIIVSRLKECKKHEGST